MKRVFEDLITGGMIQEVQQPKGKNKVRGEGAQMMCEDTSPYTSHSSRVSPRALGIGNSSGQR